MPRLVFTPQLRRFLDVTDAQCSALTLRAALSQAFEANPRLAGYVPDQVATDGLSLLMGSTTGSLWASGDGGEHWASVSQHLPPIYAVRCG